MVIIGYALSKAPDFIPNLEKVTGEKWGYWGLRSNIKRRSVLSELHRFLYYWFSLLIVLKCRSCKNIITSQQFYGLIVAFYSRLLHLKKRYSLTVLTFIYKPQNSFWGNVYFKFVRYIVISKYIDAIMVYSEGRSVTMSNCSDVRRENSIMSGLGRTMKASRLNPSRGIISSV